MSRFLLFLAGLAIPILIIWAIMEPAYGEAITIHPGDSVNCVAPDTPEPPIEPPIEPPVEPPAVPPGCRAINTTWPQGAVGPQIVMASGEQIAIKLPPIAANRIEVVYSNLSLNTAVSETPCDFAPPIDFYCRGIGSQPSIVTSTVVPWTPYCHVILGRQYYHNIKAQTAGVNGINAAW